MRVIMSRILEQDVSVPARFSLSWHYKFFICPLVMGVATWAALTGPLRGLKPYCFIAACLCLWFYALTVSYRVEVVANTITFFRLAGKRTLAAEDITYVEDALLSIKVFHRGGYTRVSNLLQNFSILSSYLKGLCGSTSVQATAGTALPPPSTGPRNLTSDHFKRLPKGSIRRNNNYYGWVFAAATFIGIGSIIVRSGKVVYHGILAFEGQPAVVSGILVMLFGLYILYYLFFQAEAEELKLGDFHEIDDFDDIIDGYNTKFNIEHTVTISDTSCISVFYYRLEIRFNKGLNIGLDIKQRDRLEHFLWLIGITRFFDVHTDSRHFDSHYRVNCSNPLLFKTIFSGNVVSMLEEFDKSYPPIRKKNGILRITDTGFRYVEGPYGEDQRLFDPHRGKIEDLFRELVKIMREIEKEC